MTKIISIKEPVLPISKSGREHPRVTAAREGGTNTVYDSKTGLPLYKAYGNIPGMLEITNTVREENYNKVRNHYDLSALPYRRSPLPENRKERQKVLANQVYIPYLEPLEEIAFGNRMKGILANPKLINKKTYVAAENSLPDEMKFLVNKDTKSQAEKLQAQKESLERIKEYLKENCGNGTQGLSSKITGFGNALTNAEDRLKTAQAQNNLEKMAEEQGKISHLKGEIARLRSFQSRTDLNTLNSQIDQRVREIALRLVNLNSDLGNPQNNTSGSRYPTCPSRVPRKA